MEENISKAPGEVRMLLPGFVWHQILEKSPSSYHRSAGGKCSVTVLGCFFSCGSNMLHISSVEWFVKPVQLNSAEIGLIKRRQREESFYQPVQIVTT